MAFRTVLACRDMGRVAQFALRLTGVVRSWIYRITISALFPLWMRADVRPMAHLAALLADLNDPPVRPAANQFTVEFHIVRYPGTIESEECRFGVAHKACVNQVWAV